MRPLTPRRWRLLPEDPEAEVLLQRELSVPAIIARLLAQRGITSPDAAQRHLKPSLDHLSDPFLLPDAEAACQRLKEALARRERILVHGDYDGDGVTSAALYKRMLDRLGADCLVFVPHRKRDGYDIRMPIIAQAQKEGVRLIITTDCGIQRLDEVEQARELGMDVIITDHHTPSACGRLPNAAAVVNPHRRDSRYPFRDLAGVGVAFRLGEALAITLGLKVDGFRRAYLDLAAIGTVTDVMPLLGENRVLVRYGLEALASTRKPGLQALIERSGYRERRLTARSIGFGLGPRLNAASRVDEARTALDLLLTGEPSQAVALADRLEELNGVRREEQERILGEALLQVTEGGLAEKKCLVVAGENWASSIVGIVAGKLADRYNRPAVAIALDPATSTGRGSARSISGFHLLNAIQQCSGLLTEFGGHSHAAGFGIEAENVQSFADQMAGIADLWLTDEDLCPTIDVSAELELDGAVPAVVEELERLEPYGAGNPEPLFVTREARILSADRVGQEGKHLKLLVRADGLNAKGTADAMWWGCGELADQLRECPTLDLCYRLAFNHFNGVRKVELILEDLRPPEW